MGGASNGDGSLPWAALLDPVANMKALGDIQVQALRAAGELVERLATAAETTDAHNRASHEGEQPATGAAARDGDASRLVDAWVEMLQRMSASFAGVNGSDGNGSAHSGDRVDVDVDGTVPERGLRMVADQSGRLRSGATEAWLHNGTGAVIGPLTLRAGAFSSPEGDRLAATLVFDPECIDALPTRSSRGVALTLTPEDGMHPGVYRGVVQVEGAPDVWLPVEVVVESSGS